MSPPPRQDGQTGRPTWLPHIGADRHATVGPLDPGQGCQTVPPSIRVDAVSAKSETGDGGRLGADETLWPITPTATLIIRARQETVNQRALPCLRHPLFIVVGAPPL